MADPGPVPLNCVRMKFFRKQISKAASRTNASFTKLYKFAILASIIIILLLGVVGVILLHMLCAIDRSAPSIDRTALSMDPLLTRSS